MTHSEPATPRRASRLGLYGPFVALAIALTAWSGAWWWLRNQVLHGLAAVAAARREAGGTLAWRSAEVGGYPFRIDVDLADVVWREPTGWAISAPLLKSETSVFAPGHWVAYAPAGLVLTRPEGGSVKVTAKAIRASASHLAHSPPTLAFEGLQLTFAPLPGAAAYFLQRASALRLYTKPGPANQGALYFGLIGAQPSPEGALGQLAAGKPVTLTAEAIFDHASAFSGGSWPRAVQAWAGAGGTLALRRLSLQAGGVAVDARGWGLSADVDGRLAGTLQVRLTHGEAALARLANAGVIDPAAARLAAVVVGARGGSATLGFEAGRTTLGPVALAAAPKVY